MMGWQFWDRKKKLTVAVGVIALMMSLGVLGATVVRVANLRTVLDRPKATCAPGCRPDPTYGCKCDNEDSSGCDKDPPECCKDGYRACTWDGVGSGGSRGWCLLSQCGGPPKASSISGNLNCGLFRQTYCKEGAPCKKSEHCASGFFCNNGRCAAVSVGKAVDPDPVIGEVNVSPTVTLSWKLSEPQQGTAPYVNVYMWSCPEKTESCMVAADATADKVSVQITRFHKRPNEGQNFQAEWQENPSWYVKALKPNTRYWWKVTPGTREGVQIHADTWVFTTGSGAPPPVVYYGCVNNTCQAIPGLTSNRDGCTAVGQSCTVTPPPNVYYGCVNGTCQAIPGLTSNRDGCTAAGQSCGGQAGCTSPADCADNLTCVNGACVTPTCNPPPTVCQTATYTNHACVLTNKPNGTACTLTGGGTGVCQNGVCVASSRESQECEVCEGLAGRLCAAGLSCRKAVNAGADQGGICVKPDGTSVCGTCTTDANCPPPLVCADGRCVESRNTYLACGSNNTCVRKRGMRENQDGCTVINAACGGEAVSCWGNLGVNGRCYDCDGNGVINVLDFSCFRKRYGETVN